MQVDALIYTHFNNIMAHFYIIFTHKIFLQIHNNITYFQYVYHFQRVNAVLGHELS